MANDDLFANLREEGMAPPSTHSGAPRKPRTPDKKPRTIRGDAPTKPVKEVTIDDVNQLQEARDKALEEIKNVVTKYGAMGQMYFLANEDVYCAHAMGQHVPHIAKSLAIVAEDFPLIKQVIQGGDRYGAIATLVWATLQLGLTIGVHHGQVPYEGPIKFVVPPPPEVVARLKAQGIDIEAQIVGNPVP